MGCAAFTIVGIYFDLSNSSNRQITRVSAGLALVFFLVAAFLAWNEENRKLDEEFSKRDRPILTASFLTMGNPPQTLLRLDNASPAPAVGITIEDIRLGTKVLRFFPPESVCQGPSKVVDCQILESGWREKDNVAALFDDRLDLEDRILSGKMRSEILRLKVMYSNLDSQSSRQTWVLSLDFWYDYGLKRIMTATPSLDPLN